jgi:hypothetical protein
MNFIPDKLYYVEITCRRTPFKIYPGETDKVKGTLIYKPYTGMKEFAFWADKEERLYDDDRCSYTYCFDKNILSGIKIKEIDGIPTPEPTLKVLGKLPKKEIEGNVDLKIVKR